ncbi:MAG TPA: hypothetical protein VFH27_03345, partial [Longimicrobiaceae bacterium]|nr:hypothetical protein [Longimicrobiaceae bacterium]
MSGSDAPAPYVGLVPFSAADADYFFGRERETELVVATLSSRRLTLLFGPSGVGKSSLLRAGVLHRLQQGARSRLDRLGRDSEAVRQVVEGRPARATVRVGALPIAGRVAAGAGRHEAVDGVTPTLVMHADEERLVPALPPVPVVVSDWRDDPASLLAERLRDAVTELYGPVAGPDIAPDADVPTLLRAWSAHVRADLYL